MLVLTSTEAIKQNIDNGEGEKQSSYTKQDVNMSVGQPAASSIHSHSNGRYDIILPNGRQRGRVRENRIDRNIIKNVDKVIQVPSNCPSS